MKLTMRTFILFMVGLLLFGGAAMAQTVTGTLTGHVTDTTGAVMAGVKVSARSLQSGNVREAVTNSEGYYLLTFLLLGAYDVTAEMNGFQTIKKTAVEVELNKNTQSDFTLKPSAVSLVVEVTGEIPLVETQQGDVKTNFTAQQIADTPLPGRNFVSLVEQVSGFQNAMWVGSSNNPTNSTGSYAAFAGLGSRSATFSVDGVNNDDASENQNRQNVNVSSIQNMQVLTNNFTAEHGRAGAVVLVQTKSGGNQFHGEAYDDIQNDIMNANGFFSNQQNLPRNLVRFNQYGGTLGGPIIKDKVFFYGSLERLINNSASSYTRWLWLPGEKARACNPGETPKPGPGNQCLDPALHPNMDRDLKFMNDIMSLWNTPQLKDATPNNAAACAQLIQSGRPNRCVTVSGVATTAPDADYSGKIDWNAPSNTTVSLRYQYSRQRLASGRIIYGDNYGSKNNRQYNLGLTAIHVYNPTQTGEFRFGFGNRSTLQDVTDGNNIPVIRFSSMLGPSGTIIGTSMNVPINRRQHDTQFVYNHTYVRGRHTFKVGTDVRFDLLDDIANQANRGYWSFGSLDSAASITAQTGYTGLENFLRGYATGYQKGYGNPYAENRFGEVNGYFQDDFRLRPRLLINLGFRYEGVRSPEEIKDRFSYGIKDQWFNPAPRLGFAYQPATENSFLQKIVGKPGDFVIRGGYGISYNRVFQSIYSQNGASIRAQPPNGYQGNFGGLCPYEIGDPSSCPTYPFSWAPGVPSSLLRAAVDGGNVKVAGGRLTSSLLTVDPGLRLPYIQSWNLTMGRTLPDNMSVEITYNGNRGIGLPFYDYTNTARFNITSPVASADIGGGTFVPIVFDRACVNSSDPMCRTYDASGNFVSATSGPTMAFTAYSSKTATLAQKGIVIVDGVPHGYISSGTNGTHSDERRPDPNYTANMYLRNFAWTYYNAAAVKFTKRSRRGLNLTGTYTFGKTIDTGSEATSTGVDTNAPTGKGNAARSLRALSGFDARHRAVFTYSYEVPFFRQNKGVLGYALGGWQIAGITTFQSGTPFSVVAGYDVNLDGLGGDRPWISDTSYLGKSVDNGRQQATCPVPTTGGVCPSTKSELQLPGTIFLPSNSATITGDNRFLAPGSDGTGTIGRNTFFTQGINNTDATLTKSFRIPYRETWRISLRLEMYNLFNRVMFGVPARTVLSSTPIGRITGQVNVSNYVSAYRSGPGSRMGQVVLRFTF